MTRPWTVLKPSALEQIAEGLWCVTDVVPTVPGANRRMTIVKRADGGLLFFNAIPLTEALLAQVRALGTPAQLVLPNHFHALDGHAFAERLGVTMYAPEPSLPKLRAQPLSVRALSECPPDAAISFRTVDGFVTGEAVLIVTRGQAATVITADVITNVPHLGGFNGLLMRVVGFTGAAPKLPRPVRMRVGKDLKQVKGLLGEIAKTPGLTQLVPSHGNVLRSGAREAVERIAASL